MHISNILIFKLTAYVKIAIKWHFCKTSKLKFKWKYFCSVNFNILIKHSRDTDVFSWPKLGY